MGPVLAEYQANTGVWGGPVPEVKGPVAPVQPGEEAGLLLAQSPISEVAEEEVLSPDAALALGAVQDPGRVFASVAGSSLLIYKVQKGDTLSSIAQDFGITVQTVISSNPEVKSRALRVGQELAILPLSGVLYQLKPQESLELVAMKHGLTVDQIKEFNKSVSLVGSNEGATIIIPSAVPKYEEAKEKASPAPALPNLRGYYAMPTTGFNWGKLHNMNAVDIANACGTSVVAAQEGLVMQAPADGWNGGYGSFVLLEHPNGTKTRYAHLDKVLVSVGDYVDQREKIGVMGNTGESTGCHLHFEVDGAKNPFVK